MVQWPVNEDAVEASFIVAAWIIVALIRVHQSATHRYKLRSRKPYLKTTAAAIRHARTTFPLT